MTRSTVSFWAFDCLGMADSCKLGQETPKPRKPFGRRPDPWSGERPRAAASAERYMFARMLRSTDILTQTPQGLYCPLGDFHVDPVRPVPRALITHGHSDHARAGHGSVLATRETLRIMAVRYGADFAGATQAAPLGETIRLGEVAVRFAPAGHVLGSAQIAIEAGACRICGVGRLQARRGPDLLPFEVIPATCSSPSDFRAAGVPPPRHPRARCENCSSPLRCFPSAPTSSGPTRWARRSGHGPDPRGRL
jgi:hypothetical protein